ncbi:alpha/beta-hydrolase [Polyplosphaeria fusca]|uniref:Alpha/beta-hydrolase n=1 Tax=Polyplosphaeria fusca TaxID=682080 RepID=A0A9P4QPY2_9PLEO|nr:alpha/beta-hydrolase [Polyplosphaeria fusca]
MSSFSSFALLATLSLSSLVAGVPSNTPANCEIAPPTSTFVTPKNGDCKDYTITDKVTSENLIWAQPKFKDNYDVAAWLFNETRKDSRQVFHPFADPENVTAEYTLAGTFCKPKKMNGNETTVLLATHGLGYDRRYWSSSYKPDEYNFVQYALDQGYSVFYYDRLGTGKSDKPSGFVNQASIQAEQLTALAKSIRAGKYTSDIKAEKIVLVGHSYGSYLSTAVIVNEPDLAEGIVLTGLAFPTKNDTASGFVQPFVNTIFANRIGSTLSPAFSDRDTGYIGFGDIFAHVHAFFHQPNYETQAAEYAQSISQPGTVLEFATLATLSQSAQAYKGDVLVTTGEFDILICSGECYSTYAPKAAKKEVFTGANRVETYILPGAGHGVNFAKNAMVAYKVIGTFLGKI